MRRRTTSLSILFLIVFGFGFLPNSVLAKYPEKGIRFVVPWAPGGGGDILARVLTRYVNPYLEDKVYVENVTGAAGAIGYREAAKASPDGYTITLTVTSLTVGPHVIKDFPSYDLLDQICIIAQDPVGLFVKSDSRFKTTHDLISYAKAHPGVVNAGHAGIGSGPHIAIEAFAAAIGAKLNMVPFKGDAPAVVAAAGGHVDIAPSGCSQTPPLVGGKKIRPILTFGTTRSRLYPDIPLAKELGYDVVTYLWRGVACPKGVPKEIKTVLVDAFRKAMENEECKKLIDQMGLERIYLGPEEAGPWLKAQDDFFRDVVTKIGIQIK